MTNFWRSVEGCRFCWSENCHLPLTSPVANIQNKLHNNLKNHKEEPDILVQLQRKVATVAADSVNVFHHHHHHHVLSLSRRGSLRRCTTMSTVDSTFPELSIGRVESFRSWSSHLFRGRLGAGPSSSRATCPNTEMRRRGRRWDSEVRPVRCSSSSFQTRFHRIPSSYLRHFWWKASRVNTSADSKVQVSAAYSSTDKTSVLYIWSLLSSVRRLSLHIRFRDVMTAPAGKADTAC